MAIIKKKHNYRRADNGQYTTKKYADKHPRTTVRETVKQVVITKEKSINFFGKKPPPNSMEFHFIVTAIPC